MHLRRVILALALALSGCAAKSTGTTTQISCDGVASTSTAAMGHVHSLCVPANDLAAPPATGASYTTSLASGHLHRVTLSEAQLRAIANGQTVDAWTSVDEGHSHAFVLTKFPQPGENAGVD